MGLTEAEFYGCLSCYEGLIDQMAWDGPAFSAAMAERIIDAGLHADQLLSAYPYLTRMYTTISPAEMTEDPFFHQNADLADVDNRNQIAQQFIDCDNNAIWTLPDGRQVYSPTPFDFPDFAGEMPWEEEIEDAPDRGDTIDLVNNTELINVQLAEYNCGYNFPSAEACGNPPDSGTGTGTGGPGGGPGGTGSDTGDDPDQTDGGGGDGCGCSAQGGEPSDALAFGALGLGLLGLRRRRRR
jgi:MYXO-CTERM domain-containing protein